MSNPVPSTNPTPQDAATPCTAPAAAQAADSAAPASSAASELDEALFGENSQAGENAKSTKDSIMALFGPGTSGNQQMFGIPGAVTQITFGCKLNFFNLFDRIMCETTG